VTDPNSGTVQGSNASGSAWADSAADAELQDWDCAWYCGALSTGTKKRNPKTKAIMTKMSAFLRLIGERHPCENICYSVAGVSWGALVPAVSSGDGQNYC
jgi:hypothetical protein